MNREIIHNLKNRIARLEASKIASSNTVYTVDKGEVNAILQLSKKMRSEDLELVFLNALSHNLNNHRDALSLSRGLGITSTNLWLGEKRIARLSNILASNKVLSVDSLGRVFIQYCREHIPKKERTVLRMLKSIGISLREFDLNKFNDILELLFPNFDGDDFEGELGSYAERSLKEEDEENDWGDHGFDYEYGSQRGYHSQWVNRAIQHTVHGKGYVSFHELDDQKMVDLHPDFDFIVDLIDLNDLKIDWDRTDIAYDLIEHSTSDSSSDDGWDIESIKWGSVEVDKGKLHFYVDWVVIGEEEEEEEPYFNEPDDDYDPYDEW